MIQGASVPLIAKLAAAAVVTSSAGVVTYQVAERPDPEPVVVVEDAPDGLALAGEREGDDGEKPDDSSDDKTDKVEEPSDKPEDKLEVEQNDEADEPKDDESKEDDSDKSKDEAHDEASDKDADTTPPEIAILSPKNKSHHDDKVIVFEGETEPGATVFAGPYEATVDGEGNWRIELVLSPGANTAKIAAKDAAGNVAYATVTVYLDVEKETDKPAEHDKEHDEKEGDKEHDEVKDVAFSANQKYGTCDAEVPYEKFWGTATPNTVVEISSPYGSAAVEVNKYGHWEKKIYFEGAPIDQPFTITVYGANGSQSFSFVAKAPHAEEPHPEK